VLKTWKHWISRQGKTSAAGTDDRHSPTCQSKTTLPSDQLKKDTHLFLAFGTVCWPGNIDIAPETLYDRSVPIVEEESAP